MADARPLRDVFTDLVGDPGSPGDPAALLSGQGHPGLPDDLVAEAVVSYADTAPVEVAEHLAPYVAAHSVIGAEPGAEEPVDWPGLLATAPDAVEVPEEDVPADEPVHDAEILDFGTGADDDIADGAIEDEPTVADEVEEVHIEAPVESAEVAHDWTLEDEAVIEIDEPDDDADDLPV